MLTPSLTSRRKLYRLRSSLVNIGVPFLVAGVVFIINTERCYNSFVKDGDKKELNICQDIAQLKCHSMGLLDGSFE